ALQTPFPPPDGQNVRKVRLEINSDADLKGCQFVLHKKPNEWLKNGSTNFLIDFAKAGYLMFVLHDPSVNQWLKDAGRDFAFELPEEVCKAPEPAVKARHCGCER
ncbi:Peptidylprolyl isomerase, partial [Durusdinium trenchii]